MFSRRQIPHSTALAACFLLLLCLLQPSAPVLGQDAPPDPAPDAQNSLFVPFIQSSIDPAASNPPDPPPTPDSRGITVPVFSTEDPAKPGSASSTPSGETDLPLVPHVLSSNAVRNLAGFRSFVLPRNDDSYTGAIDLEFPLNYFGVTYSRIFVNNNGNVTLDSGMGTFTPFDLTSTARPIIAPFFADVDTRGSQSNVVTYGYDTVDGHRAFGVNWVDVGYYSYQTDKLNSFQLVLIERSDTGAGNFDIEFNYDRILWETGSASGGSGGLGGYSARAGYSNGSRTPGTFYEFAGSAVNGGLLDSNASTGLIFGRVNSNLNGRYRFFVRSGAVNNGLSIYPSTVPADSNSSATVTLGGATPGHRIQFRSSLPGVTFLPRYAVANSGGAASTTVKSSVAGRTILTVQDLDTGYTFPATASILFTVSSPGQLIPPENSPAPGAVTIANVSAEYLLSNFYPVGLGRANNTIDVTVDWAGHPEGSVEFRFNNGEPYLVAAVQSRASKEFDFGAILQAGQNSLAVRAIAADGSASQAKVFSIFGWTSESGWLRVLLASLPLLSRNEPKIEFSIMIPGEPIGSAAIDIWLPGKPTKLTPQFVGKVEVLPEQGRYNVDIGGRFYRDSGTPGRKPWYGRGLFTVFGNSDLEVDGYGTAQGRFSTEQPYLATPDRLQVTAIGRASFEWEESILKLLRPIQPVGPILVTGLELAPAPVYNWIRDRGKFYLTLTPELQGRANCDIDAQGPRMSSTSAYFQLEMEGGVKIDVFIAEGKIYLIGGGRIDLGVIPEFGVDRARLYGEAGYKLKAGWFQASDSRKFEWTPYQRQATAGLAYDLLGQALGSNWQLIPRTYLEPQFGAYEAFSPESASAAFAKVAAIQTSAQSSSLFAANVFEYSEPDLALLDDSALLVWTHDDPGRPLGQGYDIRFSRWDGSTWSEPANLTNDTYPDSRPQVIWVSPQKAIAVWQRLNDPALAIDATLDVTQTRKFELAWSTYDAPTNRWSAPVWLTQDPDANAQTPALSRAADGSIWLVWRSNPQGLLSSSSDSPDRVMAARWNGSGWSTAVVVAGAVLELGDLSVGHNAQQAAVVWTAPMTPTGSMTPTQQIYASRYENGTWSAPSQLTDSNQQHANPRVVYYQEQPYIVFLADNTLTLQPLQELQTASFTAARAAASLQDGQAVALPGDLQVDQFRVLQDSAGNLSAVFTGQRGQQRDIFFTYYDAAQSLWGNPRNLTVDSAAENYPTAVLDSSNALLMAFSRTEIVDEERTTVLSDGSTVTYTVPTEGRSDLYTFSSSLRQDVAATSLEPSSLLPVPGEAVVLTATLFNQGDLPAVNLGYAWLDNGTIIGEYYLDNAVVAGEVVVVTTTYAVAPGSSQAHQLAIAVDPQNVIAEADEENNLNAKLLFGPDLAVISSQITPQDAEQYTIINNIANLGAASTLPTTLHIGRGDTDTTLPVPSLAPGQAVTITALQEYGTLAAGSYTVTVTVNPEQQPVLEQDVANNTITTTLRIGPDLLLDSLYFQAGSPLETSVPVTLAVFNNSNFTSSEAVIHFARRGDGTEDALLDSQVVPELSPNGYTVVTATLPGPLGCGIYAQVEPDPGVPEHNRSNNFAYFAVDAGRCAAFSQSAAAAIAPASIVFTDTSNGDNTSWLWDFGDGTGSSDRNPAHVYTTKGVYTVTLTVRGDSGSDQYTRRSALIVYQAASADFTMSSNTGVRPHQVTFSDLSTGDIDTWQWDFGDGSTSSARNPSYTYLQSGEYTVTLTVKGAGGVSASTATVSVAPFGPPSTIQIRTSPDALTANGSSQAKVTIQTADAKGNAVPGQAVRFSASSGTVNPQTTTTDAGGTASTLFTAPTRSGQAAVTAVVAGLIVSKAVVLLPGAVASLRLAATPSVLPANGTSTSQVRATLLDAFENGIPGVPVSFTSTAGSVNPVLVVTGEDGVAVTTFKSERRITKANITASSGVFRSSSAVTLTGGVVTGRVFFDINLNRTLDAGENGLPGVRVTLEDTALQVKLTAVSDANGVYLFQQTPPGQYTIAVAPAGSYRWTTRMAEQLLVKVEGNTGPGFGAAWILQLPHVFR